MTTNNANHTLDNNGNVEIQLQEIAERGNIHFVDVTFNRDYPIDVGEYRALVGFKDQQDAEMFAKLTGGEFALFYKEDGWQLLSCRGSARITDIYKLAGIYPVVLLDGNENLYQLCEKVHGKPLVEYTRGYINNNEVPESWIENAVECYENSTSKYPEGIKEEDEDVYDEVEYGIREGLRYLENFKGYKGFIVVDDINWSVAGEYETEYPAHYHEDNRHYIFGVLYPKDREEEIRKKIG